LHRTFLGNAALGASAGYAIYLAIEAIFELFGQDGFDVHRFLSEARAAIYIPVLASRSFRGELNSEQILDGSLALVLIVTGTVAAVWMGLRKQRAADDVARPRLG